MQPADIEEKSVSFTPLNDTRVESPAPPPEASPQPAGMTVGSSPSQRSESVSPTVPLPGGAVPIFGKSETLPSPSATDSPSGSVVVNVAIGANGKDEGTKMERKMDGTDGKASEDGKKEEGDTGKAKVKRCCAIFFAVVVLVIGIILIFSLGIADVALYIAFFSGYVSTRYLASCFLSVAASKTVYTHDGSSEARAAANSANCCECIGNCLLSSIGWSLYISSFVFYCLAKGALLFLLHVVLAPMRDGALASAVDDYSDKLHYKDPRDRTV